jgi:hypothetical protein
MTPEEREHVNQILTQQAPLNVDEAFLVDLVCRQDVEINDIMLQKTDAVRDAQQIYSIERQQKHKAIAALCTVLARIKYAAIGGEPCFVADWMAPTPGRDDGLRNKGDDLADKAQYPGRLEDWLEQTIAGLE